MRRSRSGSATTSMTASPSPSPKRIVPSVGVCSVAIVRISVDLPAPFGPSRPYMPRGIDSVTWSRARVPFA